MSVQLIYMLIAVGYLIFMMAVAAAGIYLFVLVIKALRKYINSKDVREEKRAMKKSLAELLRENRLRCKMTQEFGAEALGVSRPAVSKWDNGTSDPSTSNLMALAKLYGVPAEDLLKGMLKGQDEEPCPQEESRL